MRTREQRFSPPTLGGSSLLVIFAVLCLTVFALLGLSTVQADSRLSEASANAVSAYYQADAQAESTLALMRSGQTPDGISVHGDIYSFVCPISETQELQVEVQHSGEAWTVLRWQAVSVTQWEADDSLDVWDGELIF